MKTATLEESCLHRTLQRVLPEPIEKSTRTTLLPTKKPTRRKRPAKRPTRLPQKGLSVHQLRVLVRTRMAMDFGKRIISAKEAFDFVSGPPTGSRTWDWLCAHGYVKNISRIPYVAVLKKGLDELKRAGK